MESAKSVLRGWSSTGDVVVGFCQRPPDEDKEVDEVYFRPLEEFLEPQAEHEHSKRFLE